MTFAFSLLDSLASLGFYKLRVFNRVYDRTLPKSGLVEIKRNGVRLLVPVESRVSQELIHRNWNNKYYNCFMSKISPSSKIVDIGAFVGSFSLPASRIARKVYAIEAFRPNFEVLLKNIQLNKAGNVVAINKAVSDRTGKQSFFVSLNPSGARFKSDNRRTIEIETARLDDLIPPDERIDVMKVNTLGAEGLVWAGAKEFLLRNRPNIVMLFWLGGLREMGTDPLKLIDEIKSLDYSIEVITASKSLVGVRTIEDAVQAIPDLDRRDLSSLRLFLKPR